MMGQDDKAGAKKEAWLLATYCPVGLFALKTTYATNKGGKTLLVPTPYAIKLALVDACFRAYGPKDAEDNARYVFEQVKDKAIRLSPPEHCVVQNTFVKIKQESREGAKGTYDSTVAYREFCFFEGELVVALNVEELEDKAISLIKNSLKHINYFGKRGGYFQFIKCERVAKLPSGFSLPEDTTNFKLDAYAVMQPLDDVGDIDDADLFDRVNSYSDKSLTLGRHRILKNTFLPYRLIRSSRNYTYYARD